MVQQGPLRSLSSFSRPEDSFILDPEIIKKDGEKGVPYLSGYFLLGLVMALGLEWRIILGPRVPFPVLR